MDITNNIRKIPTYVQLLLILYIYHTTIPVVGFYTPAFVNASVLGFLYIYIFSNSKSPKSNLKYLFGIFSITILSILYFGLSDIAFEVYGLVQVMIYPIIALFLIESNDAVASKRIFAFTFFSYVLTAITTYIGCTMYPGASRELAGSSTMLMETGMFDQYKMLNIGSFNFVYSLVLLLPVVIFFIRSQEKKRYLYIGVLAVFLLTIFKMEYTTALLLTGLSLLIFFFPYEFKTKHIRYLIVFLVVFFVLGRLFLGQALIDISSRFADSEAVSERFYDLGTYLNTGDTGSDRSDVDSRIEMYEKSINSFMASPLWGGSQNIGGHSYILDNLGKFGFIGLFAMVYMIVCIYRLYYKKYHPQSYYGYIMFALVLAVVMMYMNPKDNLGVITLTIPLFALVHQNNNIK